MSLWTGQRVWLLYKYSLFCQFWFLEHMGIDGQGHLVFLQSGQKQSSLLKQICTAGKNVGWYKAFLYAGMHTTYNMFLK